MTTTTAAVIETLFAGATAAKREASAAKRAAKMDAKRADRRHADRMAETATFGEYRTGIVASAAACAVVAKRRAAAQDDFSAAAEALGMSASDLAREVETEREAADLEARDTRRSSWADGTEFGYPAAMLPTIESVGNRATARAKMEAMRASVAYRAGHAVLASLPLCADAVVVTTADGHVQVRRVETVPSETQAAARVAKLEAPERVAKLDAALADAEAAAAYADAAGVASMRTAAAKRYVKVSAKVAKWEDSVSAAREVLALSKVAINGRAIGVIVATVGINAAAPDMWSYYLEGPAADKMDAAAEALDTRRDLMPMGMRSQLRPAKRTYRSDATVAAMFKAIDRAESYAMRETYRVHQLERELAAAEAAELAEEAQREAYKARRALAAKVRRAADKLEAAKLHAAMESADRDMARAAIDGIL